MVQEDVPVRGQLRVTGLQLLVLIDAGLVVDGVESVLDVKEFIARKTLLTLTENLLQKPIDSLFKVAARLNILNRTLL